MKSLYFDLDGTLIDSRLRVYRLFCDLVPGCGLSFDQYWEIKRRKVSHAEMLADYFDYGPRKIADTQEKWLDRIEDLDLLKLDKPFEHIDILLARASSRFNLHLITARQKPGLVQEQLEDFGWSGLFSKVLVTEQRFTKSDLIAKNSSYCKTDMVIGDTGEDIETGRKLGMRTIAVSYGILDGEVLRSYSPDVLLDSPESLKEYLLRSETGSA